jgi:hypothetical protein
MAAWSGIGTAGAHARGVRQAELPAQGDDCLTVVDVPASTVRWPAGRGRSRHWAS